MHVDQIGRSNECHVSEVRAAWIHRVERLEVRVGGILVAADDLGAQSHARRPLHLIEGVSAIDRCCPSSDVAALEVAELRDGFGIEVPLGTLAEPATAERVASLVANALDELRIVALVAEVVEVDARSL